MRRASSSLVPAGFFLAILSLSSCATQPSPTAQRHHFDIDFAAIGGRTSEINHWVDLNGDCSVAGLYSVQIVAPPAHGQAQVTKGQFFPRYGRLDARAACATIRRDGLALRYTPSPGYAGADHLAISVISPRGGYWTTDVHILVTPVAEPGSAAPQSHS